MKTYDDHPEFDVEQMDGELMPGHIFELRELDFTNRYSILAVEAHSNFVTIKVDKPIPWDEFHVGEIVSF